ncbi:hypothetical protein DFQ28_006709 [Apophysomyces sp. BC1034]|nr:hypothetical protein DFQ30_006492 [Apophysomyces sp. BC1015]KAG0180598.1 hypothetical protein DFQ29_000356 [Apophysomyces sp. BC1021]KAG0187224.1 hypothetical protein DFQ28_006709 [Apophysomyces sp. BC1034]
MDGLLTKLEIRHTSNVWYIIIAVVMSSLNHPEDIPCLYRHIATLSDDNMLLRLREGLFKSFPIAGYPKVINALQELHKAVPDSVKANLNAGMRAENTWEDVVLQRERGLALFETIYERHSQRVLDSMSATHPDLAQTAINHLYGPVMSDTRILSAHDTSLILVAGLMAQNLPSQLKGHWNGARHNGVAEETLEEVKRLVEQMCEYYGIEI